MDLNGWYKIKPSKGFGFSGCKIHYFFKSYRSLCNQIEDPANNLVLCENVDYKKM